MSSGTELAALPHRADGMTASSMAVQDKPTRLFSQTRVGWTPCVECVAPGLAATGPALLVMPSQYRRSTMCEVRGFTELEQLSAFPEICR